MLTILTVNGQDTNFIYKKLCIFSNYTHKKKFFIQHLNTTTYLINKLFLIFFYQNITEKHGNDYNNK